MQIRKKSFWDFRFHRRRYAFTSNGLKNLGEQLKVNQRLKTRKITNGVSFSDRDIIVSCVVPHVLIVFTLSKRDSFQAFSETNQCSLLRTEFMMYSIFSLKACVTAA